MLRSREPRPRPCAAPGLSTSGCPGLGTQPGHCQQPPRGHSPLSRASPALPHARRGCHWMSPLCCASPRQPRACPHGHPHPGVCTRVCTCTCTAPSQPLQPWPPVPGDFSTRGGGRKTHPEQTWQRERALGTHPLPAATPLLTFAQAPSEAAVGEGIKWEAGAAPTEQSPSAARPAMKVSVLLLLVCVAVLAVGARADTPDDTDTVVRKVQEYVKQATDVVKSVFTTVQESEAAQQARKWLSDNADVVKQQLARLKEQLSEFWKLTPGA
ncbi:apolipoprotein C-III isoform X2 [Cygnus olor]|uniref:apolipoprotein C-III isoform X2 n=1 Tax=Cygnus olor TaxID=8869 RepID=UPI001ADE1518|nr:apolipoprotein C-III isoform X2 [Cygnus olor]